ncbi:MAG: pilus assembly protein PilM [Muribaculaceae bacterium]|nr:pilus assembly protein PilM [Muribaculaceae bacterium]
MEPRYIAAIEIGSSKVTGGVGILTPDGVLSITAIEESKLIDAVRYGCVQNVEKVAEKITAIILKLENQISPYKIKGVYLNVGGRSLMSYSREVERTLPDEREITDRIMQEIKDSGRDLPIERDIVAVEPREFLVDNISTSNPVGTFGQNIRAFLNVLACKPQIRKNLNRVFTEKLPQYKIMGTVVRQLAEADTVLSSDERRLGCMLVDFGAETTTVSIYRNDVLQFLSTIPLGSRNITRDITALKYLEEKAEDLKKAVGNANPDDSSNDVNSFDGIDTSEINAYIQARAGEIVANISEQMVFAGLQATDIPGGIILIGGGARLKGLTELFKSQTGLKVRIGLPNSSLRIEARQSDAIDIISLINYVAQHSPKNCVEKPEIPKPVEQPTDTDTHTETVKPINPTEEKKPATNPKKQKSRLFSGIGARIKGMIDNVIDPIDNSELDEEDDE